MARDFFFSFPKDGPLKEAFRIVPILLIGLRPILVVELLFSSSVKEPPALGMFSISL